MNEDIFEKKCVCWLCLWWRELDGYGVVMGLFEGLFREERITENDERIWSRELFDSFLMPLCVFVCVDVYKAFEHLQTVFIIQIIPLLPCTLEPSCALTRSWRGHMHSLMSYHHSGFVTGNKCVREGHIFWVRFYVMKAVSKCGFELYSIQNFRIDATVHSIHTAYVNSKFSELRLIHKILSFWCLHLNI